MNYRNDCESSKLSVGEPEFHGIKYLEGITVCVDYSDFLDHALNENLHHFDEFVVVTSHHDKHTQEVCRKHSVNCIKTDLMHESGDKFNKGIAINLGLAHLRHADWLIHLDADIILPDRFRTMVAKSRLQKHCIYGADRQLVKSAEQWRDIGYHQTSKRQYHHHFMVEPHPDLQMGARIVHNEFGWVPIGFFQMWHSQMKHRYPINQGSAEHTDLLFACQWPSHHRCLLPTIFVKHLESEPSPMGHNWNGRKSKQFKIKK